MSIQDLQPTGGALSVPECAAYVGLSRSRVYELIGEGRIEARKIGARTIVLRRVADAFLEALPRMPASRAA